jgi:hypothetical protein
VLVQQFNVSPVNPAVAVPPAPIAQGAPDPAHMDRYIPHRCRGDHAEPPA